MSLDKWKTGNFKLPGIRPGVIMNGVDGGCPTHHRCLETLNRATPEEAEMLRAELVQADVALFTALGHYWTAMGRIHQAELEEQESLGLKEAGVMLEAAIDQLKRVRRHEEKILEAAQPIEYSAYFVRRHEVLMYQTESLYQGIEAMGLELADGFYPAPACSQVNQVLTQMMAHFELDARIEGVIVRFEYGAERVDAGTESI